MTCFSLYGSLDQTICAQELLVKFQSHMLPKEDGTNFRRATTKPCQGYIDAYAEQNDKNQTKTTEQWRVKRM